MFVMSVTDVVSELAIDAIPSDPSDGLKLGSGSSFSHRLGEADGIKAGRLGLKFRGLDTVVGVVWLRRWVLARELTLGF